jgi:hypothetical protein
MLTHAGSWDCRGDTTTSREPLGWINAVIPVATPTSDPTARPGRSQVWGRLRLRSASNDRTGCGATARSRRSPRGVSRGRRRTTLRLTAGSRSFCRCLRRVTWDCLTAPIPRRDQDLPTCRWAPGVAASCRELWREKGKVVQTMCLFTCSEHSDTVNAWEERTSRMTIEGYWPAGYQESEPCAAERPNRPGSSGRARRVSLNCASTMCPTSRRVMSISSRAK